MDISLTTPALLFPAISLLLLAFTNRFLALASLIRNLHARYQQNPDGVIKAQIKNLRARLHLIKSMQALGVSSLFVCVFCMFLIYGDERRLGEFMFGISLILMMASLAVSIKEILISIRALNLELSDMEDGEE